MSFPRKLLAPGEEIVSDSFPHWSLLVPRIAIALLVDAGCVAVVVLWGSAPLFVGWMLLAIGLIAIAAALAKVISWRATELVVTTRRVVYRSGVLHRVGREIPLDRIQDVTYRQSLLERILGSGSLTVESAGESGQEPFPDVAHPAAVQSLINRLISSQLQPPWSAQPAPRSSLSPPPEPPALPTRFVSSRPPAPPEEPPMAPEEPSEPRLSHSEELRHLEELHRLGVLTDAEYEYHRRQLRERP